MEADSEGKLDACQDRRVKFHCHAPFVCGRRKIKRAKETNTKRPAIASDRPNTPIITKKKTAPSSVAITTPVARVAEIVVLLIAVS